MKFNLNSKLVWIRPQENRKNQDSAAIFDFDSQTAVETDGKTNTNNSINYEAVEFISKHWESPSVICLRDSSPSFSCSSFALLSYLVIKRHFEVEHALKVVLEANPDVKIDDSALLALASIAFPDQRSVLHLRHLRAQFAHQVDEEVLEEVLRHFCAQHGGDAEATAAGMSAFLARVAPLPRPAELFAGFDEDFYRAAADRRGARRSAGELQLWPPAQRQKLLHSKEPLRWTAGVLSVSVDGAASLGTLLVSGLVPLATALGFTVSTDAHPADAALRLSIDAAVCAARHGFELQLDGAGAELRAADQSGLLYGLHALQQLIQLHGGVVGTFCGTVSIPALAVSDRPDVETRAVSWSLGQLALLSSGGLREAIDFLGRMRVSELHVVAEGAACGESVAERLDSEHLLWQLRAACRSRHIALVPTLAVRSLSDLR